MLTERAPHRPTPPPPQDLAKGAVTQFKELGDRADTLAPWLATLAGAGGCQAPALISVCF